MLHFAYGSNMSRAVMREHAPGARPIGVAELADHRFVITTDGHASIERMPAGAVHGVLWRLTPRDRVSLDAWENVAGGLYRAATLPVHRAGRRHMALVYVSRPLGAGRARAGYMERVIAAAREWKLPEDYVTALQRFLPARPRDSMIRKSGKPIFRKDHAPLRKSSPPKREECAWT
ncbi:MAG TPA: gamma-glutamylcyclotransferase family protein [Xanthobacteraceae bacterium]|nr:gamma-glutamylcyclotransferase family protein [Xanthobacteraceae bacterium]